MVFAAFGLAFNIVSRYDYALLRRKPTNIILSYWNVYKSMRTAGRSTLLPLVYLLPFVVSAALQVLWLLRPSFYHSDIIHSPLFLPSMCAWGLQFAHHVGRMILSHVTGTPFPWWDSMWIWSVMGVLDAHLPDLLHRYVSCYPLMCIIHAPLDHL